MTYVKVDDQFPEHPKVIDIGPLAEALWLRGLCYASRNLTDGFIPEAFVRRMSDLGDDQADALIDAGLWDHAPGGYQMHDYGDWQRSREDIAAISEVRAEAGRRGGLAKSINLAKSKQVASTVLSSKPSKTYPDTASDTDTDTENVSKPTVSHPPARGGYTPEFETFWQRYPRKEPSKKEAARSWAKVSAPAEEVLAGLERWIPVWAERGDPEKIPHATTWLNQERWTVGAPVRASPNGHSPEQRRPTVPRFDDFRHRYEKGGGG